jgi:hypothetical protein
MTEGSEFFFIWGEVKIFDPNIFTSPHIIQTGSGAYRVLYPKGTGSSFPWGKVARA